MGCVKVHGLGQLWGDGAGCVTFSKDWKEWKALVHM